MKKNLVHLLVFFLYILVSVNAYCSTKDSTPVNLFIPFGYGYQVSLLDMGSRYGSHASLATGVFIQKYKWELGSTFTYLFGSHVKEDVLQKLRTPEGDFIGIDHQLAEVDQKMRGWIWGVELNKKIKIPKVKSEYLFGIKPSYIFHWIRFQNPGNTFEPIQGAKAFGYDRLSGGLNMGMQTTFRYHSKNDLIHMDFSLIGNFARTTIKRSTQFDNPDLVNTIQNDMSLGLMVKWLLPIYRKRNPDSIFY